MSNETPLGSSNVQMPEKAIFFKILGSLTQQTS